MALTINIITIPIPKQISMFFANETPKYFKIRPHEVILPDERKNPIWKLTTCFLGLKLFPQQTQQSVLLSV